MGFHDRDNCQCPSCIRFQNMIDQLQVSDLKIQAGPFPGIRISDPQAPSFASIAMQLVDPVPSKLSSAIHDSMPVPAEPLPEFIRKRMRIPELQHIRDFVINTPAREPDRTMTKDQYARWLLDIRLYTVRAAISAVSGDHPDKNLGALTDLVGQLESRVAEMFG